MMAQAREVFSERVLPLIIARASHSALQPFEWGAVEFVILGVITQLGLEFYRSGVPSIFAGWKHLPARGKHLDVLAERDKQFIVVSRLAVIVMSFHYLQFMASSQNVLWRLEQVHSRSSAIAQHSPIPLAFPQGSLAQSALTHTHHLLY